MGISKKKIIESSFLVRFKCQPKTSWTVWLPEIPLSLGSLKFNLELSDHTVLFFFFFIYWFTWKTFAECLLYATCCAKLWGIQMIIYDAEKQGSWPADAPIENELAAMSTELKWNGEVSTLVFIVFSPVCSAAPNPSLSLFIIWGPHSGLACLA